MVADRVGRFACEVEETITARELVEWSVFFRLEHEANEKARRDSEAKSKRRR
jgi:hypothetical protein